MERPQVTERLTSSPTQRPPDDRAATVRRLVAQHTGVPAAGRVVALGRGCDHACYLVDHRLVVRCGLPDAAEVEREAGLLAIVADVSLFPVPRPVFVAPDDGCLAYEWLEGVPLLAVPPAERARQAERVAAQLGHQLRALHGVDRDRLAGLVERDDTAPEDLLHEAREHYSAVSSVLARRHRSAVEAFLGAPAPPPARSAVFSHNDLGIEHVLVAAPRQPVTGILDWSDAALVDPARDFGLLYRDLGPGALDAALSTFGTPPDEEAFHARALFHARCALLEDLAFGLEHDRSEYVEKSLAGLAWLFPRRTPP
jgi:aminoglycoside phosphotransferase (APT) family kinase protein